MERTGKATVSTEFSLFLSHASGDPGLATRFMELLENDFGIAANAIYCTSRPGEIPAGISYIDHIRKHIRRARLIVLLLTPEYLKSPFCLTEMGVAWASSRPFAPLVFPPLSKGAFEATPLAGTEFILMSSSNAFAAIEQKLRSSGFNPRKKICRAERNVALAELFRAVHLAPVHVCEIEGIAGFWPERETSDTWWNEFYHQDSPPHRVALMGHSMSPIFKRPELCEVFRKWCIQGTKMQILFLAPDCPQSDQILRVSREIHFDGQDGLELSGKIRKSFDWLSDGLLEKIGDINKRPDVRFASRDLPFSMTMVDGRMHVTLYGTQAEGNKSPSLLIKGKDTEAYRAFLQQFDELWTNWSRVSPFEDPLLAYLKETWRQCMELHSVKDPHPLPPPRQAIVFPTYRCSSKCQYCMFTEQLCETPSADIDTKAFEKHLRELLEFGVSHIELSGGGEPLEHPQFRDIMLAIRRAGKIFPKAKFGLLTNGRFLDRHLPGELLKSFNEYIRVSRYEGSLVNGQAWRGSVKRLIRERHGTGCKVSIKYLLTRDDASKFLDIVTEDFRDKELLTADYVRFTSQRFEPGKSPPADQITQIEQQLWHLVGGCPELGYGRKVSIDLHATSYPQNFRCWISPLSVVVSPALDVYACCNYLHDPSKLIGSLRQTAFVDLWQASRHKELRKKLVKANCDRPYYCNCRLAHLQPVMERIGMATGNGGA